MERNHTINPFELDGISHSCPVLFHFKVCCLLIFIFMKILKNILKANSGDPDQTPHSVASDQGQHCLPTSHKKGR